MAGDPTIEPELFAAARVVQANAHVPYSKFPVGAALRTSSGEVFVGCNVENAAYPEGLCAEASAISAMVSTGERGIEALVTVCEGEALGFLCLVNAARDRPQLPDTGQLEALREDPVVAAFIRL